MVYREDELNMVRFGVIGTNWITDWFIRVGQMDPRFELTAVYSRTVDKAKEFGAKYNVTNVYTSLEEMAESGTIDAVYIASPNVFHCEQSLVFLKRKIAVLCEKPMATNYHEAKIMSDTAKENSTLLAEALRNTHEPRYKAAVQNLHKIGKIRRVCATRCQYSSRYDKFKNGVVENAFDANFAGGAALDQGIYIIEPCVQIFGMPKKIYGAGVVLHSGIDGQGTILAKYDDMEMLLSFSKISDSYAPTEIEGEDGTMFINSTHRPGEVIIRYRNGKTENVEFDQMRDDLTMYYEVAEFIDAYIGGNMESGINSLENTLNAHKLIDEYRKQVGVIYPGDKK